MIRISMVCPFCGADHSVVVDEAEYLAYEAGAMAQDAFKSLNATEREQIISLLCPTCQDEVFGSSDEDEDFCDYEIWDAEMGFDPYMGDYSFDC